MTARGTPIRDTLLWRLLTAVVFAGLFAFVFILLTIATIDTVSASNVAAGLGEERQLAVPNWLSVLTGGVVIAASGLLAALVTDRSLVFALHRWSVVVSGFSPSSRVLSGTTSRLTATVGSLFSIAVLVLVLAIGWIGTPIAISNFAVLVTFVGVRSVLPMVAFLCLNPWPALNPFRPIAAVVGRVLEGEPLVEYPPWLQSWPAILGFAVFVVLELLLPLTSDPRTLSVFVLGYTLYTVSAAVLFSPRIWFRHGDPLAVLFRLYAAVAPLERTSSGLSLSLPGSRLARAGITPDRSLVAFVVLLVWELTFNGFVVTPPGGALITALVEGGSDPVWVYIILFCLGYAIFFAAFTLAARLVRPTAPTYLATGYLMRRFAPPLLAIAAGYHLAHYVAFSLSLSPAVTAVVLQPFNPPVNPTILSIPPWVGTLELGFVLLGHVLAIWVAHGIALDVFPGRLQAIRSQFPFVLVMIGYTMVSLWLLTLPTSPPPYVT